MRHIKYIAVGAAVLAAIAALQWIGGILWSAYIDERYFYWVNRALLAGFCVGLCWLVGRHFMTMDGKKN